MTSALRNRSGSQIWGMALFYSKNQTTYIFNNNRVQYQISDVKNITKASYASWSSFCFSKEYARGWIRPFPDTIRLNPPWRLVTLRLWVQPPLRPSSQKQWYALQGCETQVKCTILRFSGCHYHGVALIAFRYSMKKQLHRGRVLHDGRVGFHLGGVFLFLFCHVLATFPYLAPAKPPPC